MIFAENLQGDNVQAWCVSGTDLIIERGLDSNLSNITALYHATFNNCVSECFDL